MNEPETVKERRPLTNFVAMQRIDRILKQLAEEVSEGEYKGVLAWLLVTHGMGCVCSCCQTFGTGGDNGSH